MKRCKKCGEERELDEFVRRATAPDGRRGVCKECDRARKRRAYDEETIDPRAAREIADREARLESDFDALKPEDFDVAVGNDGRIDRDAAREKRQEYSRSMGETANALHRAAVESSNGRGDVADAMPEELAPYLAKLAEQERRFGNRRLARSVSLALAHEALAIRMFKEAASQYLSGRIEPTGYATSRPRRAAKRTVCLLLSDLHLGSELSSLDEPLPFRAIEEARRLEYVVRQALDYKPQYRESSELLLIINGDIIEGQLGHQLRDGSPLTEQKCIFWELFGQLIGVAAQQYPSVRVVCQPGNHGRDKVRHPGRATSRKWDGHEWEMYYGLRKQAAALENVTWQLDFRAVSVVDLYGSKLGVTHGDTEIKLGNPDTKATQNAQSLDRINSTRAFGVEFDAWAFGHFHTPRYHPRNPRVVWNGALVPPNGHARSAGFVGEPCGQFLWEAVEGYPVGDVRFIEVGVAQDHDEKLGTIITPFRFEQT
jgi:hypothetical protein